MSGYRTGSWKVRPHSTHPSQHSDDAWSGNGEIRQTWNGTIHTQLYGSGLQKLCARTTDNLLRLTQQMKRLDPCLEYGVEHWHPNQRPPSAPPRMERTKSDGRWENVDVMFTDSQSIKELGTEITDDETSSYIEPTVPVNKFCYLCSTLEEHKRHMLQHRNAKRPSGKPRTIYIAPKPKVKQKTEDEEPILVKERLYKVEVFTSDFVNAGTSANVFITIKGSLDILPRTKLQKNRGCTNMCFVRASKEIFHVQGPNLGNLQILTIEHDGTKRKQGWHLEKVEITDVKGLKTWVFKCGTWLSMYEKPNYSNKVDLSAEDKHTPLTDYEIEVYTGKSKFAGTDSNVYLILYGERGYSKKIHLRDMTSGKKCFERKGVDHFRIHMNSVGEIKRIRIEHDGKGFAAGWYLDKVVIYEIDKPKVKYHCVYGGWIAKDQGDGKLWREIRASKGIPKELKEGTTTLYQITVKTGDVRYAGTDANVFIQMKGPKGITPKLKLDDSKNNFERNMIDQFNVEAVNVGPLDHIVIGHDNSGPGAGWFLDHVKIRRYLPKPEIIERMRKIKKRLKQKQVKKSRRNDGEDLSEEEDIMERSVKDKKNLKTKKKKTDNSSSSSDSSSDEGKSPKSRRKSQQDGHSRSDVEGSRVSLSSRVSRSSSGSRRKDSRSEVNRRHLYEEDEAVEEMRIPQYEEYTFPCNRWLAQDEDDSLCVRELPVDKKVTYFKD